MKKLLIIILAALVFTSCHSGQVLVKGQKHQLVLGNSRVKAKQQRKQNAKIGHSEFANKK